MKKSNQNLRTSSDKALALSVMTTRLSVGSLSKSSISVKIRRLASPRTRFIFTKYLSEQACLRILSILLSGSRGLTLTLEVLYTIAIISGFLKEPKRSSIGIWVLISRISGKEDSGFREQKPHVNTRSLQGTV